MRTLAAIALAVGFGAPVHAAPPEMTPPEVTKWIGFFDKLVSTVVKTQAACERLAFEVSNVIDQNKDAVDVARKARQSGRRLPEAAQQHMLDGVKKMVPAMQRCGNHDKVKAAFAKLDLNRKA